MSGYVELHGRGMHSGAPTSVRFEARPGPLLFRLGPDQASIEELEVVRADQGVCLKARHGSHEVDVCEHLLAALAGLGVRSGLLVSLPGPEVLRCSTAARTVSRGRCRFSRRGATRRRWSWRSARRSCMARAGIASSRPLERGWRWRSTSR